MIGAHQIILDIGPLLTPCGLFLTAFVGLLNYLKQHRAEALLMKNTAVTQSTNDTLRAVGKQIDGQQTALIAAVADAATMHGREEAVLEQKASAIIS